MVMTESKSLLKQYEEEAKEKLPEDIVEYLESHTRPTNVQPLIQTNIEKPYTDKLSPLLLGAVGAQTYFHQDGELATALAASQQKIPFIVGSNASYSIEEIADAIPKHSTWFLTHMFQDRELSKHFVQRAELAGCQAIVIAASNRPIVEHADQLDKGNANFVVDPIFLQKTYNVSKDEYQELIQSEYDNPNIYWDDIHYLQQYTNLPIYLYGNLSAEDARVALEYKIQGFILTRFKAFNIARLSSIRTIVGDSFDLIVESDITSAEELQHLIHVGADAVSIQKPYIYSLTASGHEGIESLINQFLK
ncbi:isopentenyl-diphosphate delta-isomerase II 2 [Gracilibacillus halophilus YIM-C55.5]|uniref:Isopentenyl-diphosphate delta-isomerase II 2 n=1 Tax=Gracilibacillus halophilus YIM-C55.5 TaxID=1308866 RepID=N4WUY2_9BACI|nr:alpha-hydroxy-acid oxidizing protein [Gracilibacillus halophilus]ENH96916.1 isopentenyl-diphosphate delta-isomerase II 2 [Gracilibacillus halophilus YIM-C55.5]